MNITQMEPIFGLKMLQFQLSTIHTTDQMFVSALAAKESFFVIRSMGAITWMSALESLMRL